ncbi:hypothetical protein SFC52_24415, partial [Niallia circulans]|uniref:hypothetical protein n=1 Tax=Niallia circulans TaxID=1397 RepID=UPI003981CA23
MTKKVYRSKKISILLILIVLINSFTSGFLPVASAVTNTEPVAENLYFTEKDQNEKIQELKVEQDFSIDLVLQDGQDTEAVIQLTEGISLSDESLAQEGLTYEKDTRTVHVDWSKFTALEQKKRVSMSFTNSLKENVSIQAETERDGQTYYSQALNIIPVSPETASTTERTTERTTESAAETTDSEESAAKDAK